MLHHGFYFQHRMSAAARGSGARAGQQRGKPLLLRGRFLEGGDFSKGRFLEGEISGEGERELFSTRGD